MKNKLLILASAFTVFSASCVLAMDEGIIHFEELKKPTIHLRKTADLGSADPALITELQDLLKKYLGNPNGIWVSPEDPAVSKCLPRRMWEVEQELFKDNGPILKSLRNANASGSPEKFSYYSQAFVHSNGTKVDIGN